MKLTLAGKSMLLLGVSILLFVLLTLFEAAFLGMSLQTERVITFLVLVLPASIGAILGIISFVRKDGSRWIAILGILLNGSFAIFNLLIVFFAG